MADEKTQGTTAIVDAPSDNTAGSDDGTPDQGTGDVTVPTP